jgi:ribosomal protein S18 acetylase RimI-like enzyme
VPEQPLSSRMARPQDYDAIAAVVNDWWGGRDILPALPRLFLDHFHRTSLVIDPPDAPDGQRAGGGTSAAAAPGVPLAFLIGILSPSQAELAYIHFVGVAPAARGRGVARQLYAEFFELARAAGRRAVTAITAPVNTGSIAFHQRMGFSVTGPVADYEGPGRDYVLFRRPL